MRADYQTGRRLLRERSIPPMHAANPAPAIEHATVDIVVLWMNTHGKVCITYLQLRLGIHLPQQRSYCRA